MRYCVNERGITLVACIILIVFASVAVLGVTTFIVQRFSQIEAKRISIAVVNLAEAGLHNAVYHFRLHDLAANGYFSLGQFPVDADHSFLLEATAADLLMVNTSQAALGSGRRQLVNLRIQNATNTQSIRFDRMIVTWDNSRTLRRIRIGNKTVWSGKQKSPANCSLSRTVSLNTLPATYPINALVFNGKMDGSTIKIQFVMTDGSAKELTVYPAANRNNFTVKSTGRLSGSNMTRTVEAEYNALTGRISRINEITQP
ncbi:MAG: hypothetical protein WC552_08640 [Candidatus Omnitrophota bacterium]